MPEEGDDENRFLVFIGVGIAFLALGVPDLILDGSSQLSSWGFVVAGGLFFVAAFRSRHEDFGGFLDLG